MINSELSEISYVIQAGVTTYPIGFEYHFNENNSPQLLVKIGESVAIINVDFQLSTDESEIILIPTEEEAQAQNGPNDTRWMDRIVGEELLITRDIPFVQTSDYTVGRISPEQIEYDFDRTVMRDQEILHQLSDFTVDVALAESLANAAVETANEAATAANQATATANTALETANTAIVTANDAKAVATQASQDAVDAIADSANAVNKAEAADMTATTAMEIAAEAVTLAQSVYSKTEIDNKITIINADIDANADAIQKTRADFISADSDIHTILNNHAGELTTLHNDVDAVGDQISGIEEKIPGTASASNPLVTKQQLLDEEMDIREDLNSGLSELQTQVTAQAAAIANKQDTLTAGENITIVDNVISATGGGGDFLPLAGGTMTGDINFEFGSGQQYMGVSRANGGIKIAYRNSNTSTYDEYYFEPGGFYGRNLSGRYNIRLGEYMFPWSTAYIQKINNGNDSEDLIVPTTGGTLARIEDVNAIGGEGTTGQVLTKTDDGFAWQDSAGGGATGDYLPLAGGTMTGGITRDVGFTEGSAVIKHTLLDFSGGIDPWGTGSYVTPKLNIQYGPSWNGGGGTLYLMHGTTTYGLSMSIFESRIHFSPNVNNKTSTTKRYMLGTDGQWWDVLYTRYIHAPKYSNDPETFITVPAKTGTMALVEDIDAALGDISTALTAIIGE